MKKNIILTVIIVLIVFLVGCYGKTVNPISIKNEAISLEEAKVIYEKTFKPIYSILALDNENEKINSFGDFYENLDFKYMDREFVNEYIFSTIVCYDLDGNLLLDDNGGLIFNKEIQFETALEKEIDICDAFIRTTIYKEQFSDLNSTELVIVEKGNVKNISGYENYWRKCYFKENENREWILDRISGNELFVTSEN